MPDDAVRKLLDMEFELYHSFGHGTVQHLCFSTRPSDTLDHPNCIEMIKDSFSVDNEELKVPPVVDNEDSKVPLVNPAPVKSPPVMSPAVKPKLNINSANCDGLLYRPKQYKQKTIFDYFIRQVKASESDYISEGVAAKVDCPAVIQESVKDGPSEDPLHTVSHSTDCLADHLHEETIIDVPSKDIMKKDSAFLSTPTLQDTHSSHKKFSVVPEKHTVKELLLEKSLSSVKKNIKKIKRVSDFSGGVLFYDPPVVADHKFPSICSSVCEKLFVSSVVDTSPLSVYDMSTPIKILKAQLEEGNIF